MLFRSPSVPSTRELLDQVRQEYAAMYFDDLVKVAKAMNLDVDGYDRDQVMDALMAAEEYAAFN